MSTNNRRRAHMPESTLKAWAHDAAAAVTFETTDPTDGKQERRRPTGREMVMLQDLLYSALLGLDYGERGRSNRDAEQAILDSMEFAFIVLMNKPGKVHINSYTGFYIPLQHILDRWPEESDALTA